MNTFEILYQVYRARYSLSKIQEGMGQEYLLALIGDGEHPEMVRHMLGGAPLESGQDPPADEVRYFRLPLQESDHDSLKECSSAIVHLGSEERSDEELRAIAEKIPLGVNCLWVREGLKTPRPETAEAPDTTLPSVHVLEASKASPQLCRLVLKAFPDLSIRLARDFPRVRFECARRMMARTAARNALLAAASSVTSSIPAVGFLITLLATAGETLVITASQLRLCLLMAALYGRSIDFFDRVGELWPVVGSAFGWRALARELVGVVPGAGWAFKAGVAYSGTWAVGEAARLYYEHTHAAPAHIRKQANKAAIEAARAFVADMKAATEEGDDPHDLTRPDHPEGDKQP